MGKPVNNAFFRILARWGGMGAVLGGLLFAVWGYLDGHAAPSLPATWSYVFETNASSYFAIFEDALGYIVPLLFLLGTAGFYAQCGRRAGWLARVGFILSFIAAAVGGILINSLDIWACCAYILTDRGAPPMLLDWLFWLLVGLTLLGIATTWKRTLRGWGGLSMAVGLFGWVYYVTSESFGWAYINEFTDQVGTTAEVRLIHVVFGLLFSLSWVVMGYALWSGNGDPSRTISGSRRVSRRSRRNRSFARRVA